MSEQKYYVYDNFYGSEILIRHSNDFDVDWILEEYVEHDKEDMERCAFTKSELAKIKNGALYQEPFLGETGIQPEWINPLIELVPVGDDDVSN